MMKRNISRGVAAGLTPLFLLAAIPHAAGQEYYAIASTFGTTHRVIQATISGEVVIHQNLEAGHLTETLGVDPGGRFVWMINDSVNGPSPLYRVTDAFALLLGGQVRPASEEWAVVGKPVIVPESTELITQTIVPGPAPGSQVEYQALNNSLLTASVDSIWDVGSIPEAQMHFNTASSYDPVTTFTGRFVVRYSPAEQEFSLTEADFGFFSQGQALRHDGRFLVSTAHEVECSIFQILGDGESSISLASEIEDIAGYSNPMDAAFSPSGDYVYLMGSGGIVSVEINPDTGEIIGVVEIEPAPSSNDLAITHDGQMLLQTTNRFGGIARIIPYRINSDGTIDALQAGLEVPWSTSDLEFIPPKTPPSLLGDANVDGVVDAADLVTILAMAQPTARLAPPLPFANADLDGDVDVDGEDLQGLVDLLLGEDR